MATCESRRRAVTIPVCFAWGAADPVELPNGTTQIRWGFEMLPGATMVNAQCVRHGMVACAAVPQRPAGAEPRWEVTPGTKLEVYTANETVVGDLVEHVDEILKAFKVHLANTEQTA